MPETYAVVYGGPSSEHDISVLTGLQALRILREIAAGGEVHSIYWSKRGDFYAVAPELEAEAFVNGVPPKSKQLELVTGDEGGFRVKRSLGKPKVLAVDAVVNCCHGGAGEDGRLQSALDLAGVAYTGPTANQAALGMDKLTFGAFAAALGLPTLPRTVLATESAPAFPAPWIVKPRFGGSSIGIEIVDEYETALKLAASSPHLRAGAVVEPFLAEAVDLNISVRGHGRTALSEIERPLRAGQGIYSYKDKYLTSGEGILGAPRELPAQVPDHVAQTIRDVATKVRDALPVRGVARIDFLWNGDDVWLNEINTIPGALSFYLWRESGVSYRELMSDLVAETRVSRSYEPTASGSDGSALRSAESIARKLA